jgi:hypothetical protein
MNTKPQPTSNKHLTSAIRNNVKPNLSEENSFLKSYNNALTQERCLDRYKTVLSSKLNVYHQERVTEPSNYFGIRFIRPIDKTVRHSPAGMFMQNSTKQTGLAFCKPFPKVYAQNIGFGRCG